MSPRALSVGLVVAAYGIAPRKARWVVLLVASYAFFWILSGRLIVFILASTVSVYGLALALDAQVRQRDERLANATSGKRAIRANAKRRMRAILGAGVLLNVGMLVALKYVRFFGEALSGLLGLFGHGFVVSVPPHDLPIGISFYTLMAVSYLVDVYRESVRADSNLGRVALYLSFFPQVMEGPICRYSQTAESLTAGDPLDRRSMYAGMVRILYGFAKKIGSTRLSGPCLAATTCLTAASRRSRPSCTRCSCTATSRARWTWPWESARSSTSACPRTSGSRSSRAPRRSSGSAGTSRWARG